MTVYAHALQATTPEGRKIELGRVNSVEAAVRLRSVFLRELGDEYRSFEILELEVPPPTVSSVRLADVVPLVRH